MDYLSDLIGDEFKRWSRKKVLIHAPTGLGKTTFIIKSVLPYLADRREKMLILCNRRLLRNQFWYDLVREFDYYEELQESVEIKTYQQLAEQVKVMENVDLLFCKYEAIVCDEAHFFYSDSDFNGFGTYALLQALIYAGMGKTMIFMTATAQEVAPLIEQTIRNCVEKMVVKKPDFVRVYRACGELILRDYSHLADYRRFHCVFLAHKESLCWQLATSERKSIIFIDDKEEGSALAKSLCETGKISMNEIAILNADNLEQNCNSGLVRALAICHRVPPKILITTAVLDNGVSIHDPDVGNVVIMTESKVTFLQMLGRIRAETVDFCNLYFVPRKLEMYRQRMESCEKDMKGFRELEHSNFKLHPYHHFSAVWDNPESDVAKFYRKALVIARHNYQFYTLPKARIQGVLGDAGLYTNEFSRRKIGDMYVAESKFYALASVDSKEVVYEQMKWIGKSPEALVIGTSDYQEQRSQKFIEVLLSVRAFGQEDLQEFKQRLVKEFRKEFFPDVLAKNGTISTEKLKEICARYGLIFGDRENPENRRRLYYIEMKGEEEKRSEQRK